MIRIFHIHFPAALLGLALVDAALLYAAIDVSIELSRSAPGPMLRDIFNFSAQKWLFVAATSAALFSMGVYAVAEAREIAARTGAALGLAFVMLAVAFYLMPKSRIWMSAMFPAMLATPILLAASRWTFRRAARAGLFKARVLVLGSGERAAKIESLEMEGPGVLRFACAGFLGIGESFCVDRRRVIRETDLRRACNLLQPHEIVVALDERRNTLPADALFACRLMGTRVTSFQDFLERETGRIEIEHLDPIWLVFSDGTAKGAASRCAKRLFDVAASAGFLLFFLPILLLTALAIRLDDRGPVFYSQERVGLNGRVFRILKFRSMRIDAERDGVARWAARGDSRVTRVGGFLRRTRLDEAPQMINVLKGDMSFVGPRPERPGIVSQLAREIPYYDHRHLVKPGITGWAQIRYSYADTVGASVEKLKYDLYYVKNGGIFFDAAIILQTVRVVLWGQGAR